MGLFRKNWAKELERAEALLQRDIPVGALEIAERAERKADPELRPQAASMVLRARQALLASVLAKADAAEAAGDLEDAADWLQAAIEQEPSAVRKSELERRAKELLDRSYDQENLWDGGTRSITVVAGEAAPAVDVSFQYETLITMLKDEIHTLYEGRSPDFQQAVVDLHEGRAAQAVEALQAFAEAAPDDAIAHLELGRARLFLGDAAAARDDFDLAWKALGDEPLNADDSLIMPVLWAEAALAAGEPEEVIQRLEALASAASGHVAICQLQATALMAAGQLKEAAAYLEEVTSLVPSDESLNLLLAQALVATGDSARARAGLERAIDPSCGGSCASPAPHLPSFLLLARLHLLEGGDPERARELMAWIAKARGGHLGTEEHEILAGYYRATGDQHSAAAAAAEAERLAGSGDDAVAAVDVGESAQGRTPL